MINNSRQIKKKENHGRGTSMRARFRRGRLSPQAMEAGIADHVWTIEEVVALIDSANTAKMGLGDAA